MRSTTKTSTKATSTVGTTASPTKRRSGTTSTPTAKITLTVYYEAYERYGSGGTGKRTYTGTELTVLQNIADRHSYGRRTEEDLDEGQVLTPKLVWDSIQELNGDGCDYIIDIVVGKGKKYRGPKK